MMTSKFVCGSVTAENQLWFDRRWKHLQNIPAAIKFISYEPALGPLRLPRQGPVPDWLISGGESGGGARPLNPQWVRDIIADCHAKGVAPFHKQWGTYASNPLVIEQGMTIADAKAWTIWQGRRIGRWEADPRIPELVMRTMDRLAN
jgi:protein gp37